MQSSLFEPQNLPELPKASTFEHWVFESPIPLMLIFFISAIIIFGAVCHTQRAKRFGYPILGAGILLGLGVFALASAVTTESEHLQERSRQLVLAASIGDSTTLSSILDEKVRIKTNFITQSGKERIITLATSRAAPMIESATTKEIRVGFYGPQVAKTHIKVKVKADMIPPLSWWAIDWIKPSPDAQWIATHIESLWIQGLPN
ncbi:hypothetical protein COB72_07135 [bacterium]|nr:MAG: hypothetical protein COB72_07135 [bacterium]